MTTRTYIPVLLLMTLLLSGCLVVPFPHSYVDAPRFYGRVADASTHHPISHATVTVSGYPATTVQTDSSGYFTTGISRSLHFFGISTYDNGFGMELPPRKPEGVLTVNHRGYQETKVNPKGWPVQGMFLSDRDVTILAGYYILLRRSPR